MKERNTMKYKNNGKKNVALYKYSKWEKEEREIMEECICIHNCLMIVVMQKTPWNKGVAV